MRQRLRLGVAAVFLGLLVAVTTAVVYAMSGSTRVWGSNDPKDQRNFGLYSTGRTDTWNYKKWINGTWVVVSGGEGPSYVQTAVPGCRVAAVAASCATSAASCGDAPASRASVNPAA